MDAYLVRIDRAIIDVAIRAESEVDARELMRTNDIDTSAVLGVIQSGIAALLRIPEERGIYTGLISEWLIGPTNIFGEFTR